jgi:DNA-binding NarL/FixJ family response regulator
MVLVVDDHAEFRRSVRALLEAEGFAVIGEAAAGADALAAVARLHPRACRRRPSHRSSC